jgi:IS1 family transposase
MNKLDTKRRAQIIACLCEGMSVRATCRITGADKKTVLKLLVKVGDACLDYQNKVMVNLPCKRLQADEVWSFCYSKARNVPAEKKGQFGYGDVWTWTVICADTKLIPTWRVGTRDAGTAHDLMMDLAPRLRNRVQLTTDGLRSYLDAVEDAFGIDVDYAQLVKVYGENTKEEQRRYSPAVCLGTERKVIMGEPDQDHISTSFVERHNLTIRMSNRRFTRLTNAFSKKLENHCHALAVFFMFYNFCRIHQSLRVTPAMEAGIADHVWTVEEIVGLVQEEDVVILK